MRLRDRPWLLAAAVWLMPAIFATMNALVQWRLNGWDPPTWRQLLFSGGDWLVYAFATPVIFWASRRWPIVRPHLRRRIWLHLGFAILFCVCWALSGQILDAVLALAFEPAEFTKLFSVGNRRAAAIALLSWVLTTLPFGVIVYLCVAGMAHAFDYFVQSSDREVQVARLSEQLAGAQLAALQAQVNPHFLFNTLNTVIVRARDGDMSGTVSIVEQLSALLRRTLSVHRSNEVTLDDELDLVRQYLAIEHARFPDRLETRIEVEAGLGAATVPGFAIQHLVENAIRHGIARRAEAGHIVVRIRRDGPSLVVEVSDDGPGLGAGHRAEAGHGIENTRGRLRALYGDRASLDLTNRHETGAIATLRIPFRILPSEDAR